MREEVKRPTKHTSLRDLKNDVVEAQYLIKQKLEKLNSPKSQGIEQDSKAADSPDIPDENTPQQTWSERYPSKSGGKRVSFNLPDSEEKQPYSGKS